MSAAQEPVPFEVNEAGVYLHGTKADLAIGEMLVAGRESNFEEGRVLNYVYFTATLDAATWGAELAAGEGRGHIYIVEPSGEFEDDRNVTNKRFPGIRRSPSAPASRCASWASSSTGLVTRRRSSRPCGTDSMRCSGRAQRRSRIEYAARDASFRLS
jgi:rifampin ADP-ribosylating transferase